MDFSGLDREVRRLRRMGTVNYERLALEAGEVHGFSVVTAADLDEETRSNQLDNLDKEDRQIDPDAFDVPERVFSGSRRRAPFHGDLAEDAREDRMAQRDAEYAVVGRSAHGFDFVAKYRQPERRGYAFHRPKVLEASVAWRREWTREVFAEGAVQLDRRREEFLSREPSQELVDYWSDQPENERPEWHADVPPGVRHRPDIETVLDLRREVRQAARDTLIAAGADRRAAALAAAGKSGDPGGPTKKELEAIDGAVESWYRSRRWNAPLFDPGASQPGQPPVAVPATVVGSFGREMRERLHTEDAVRGQLLRQRGHELRQEAVERIARDSGEVAWTVNADGSSSPFLDPDVQAGIDEQLRVESESRAFDDAVHERLDQLRAGAVGDRGYVPPVVEEPIVTLLPDARFDPAVTSVVLNVDPLGGPISPESATGDQRAFEYFVQTADRSVRGYLNLAARDPAASEALEREWGAERAAVQDAARNGPQPEEAMALVQRVADDATAQWYTAEIQRFAARAQVAVGQDADWMPAEEQQKLENDGRPIDVDRVPISRRHSPERFDAVAAHYPDLTAAVASLDPTHPLGQRPKGAGPSYDRALAEMLDERRGQSQDQLIVAGKGLREAGPYGPGRLAANPPDVPEPEVGAAAGFVSKLAGKAGVEYEFSPAAEGPATRCARGAEPVVVLPKAWEDPEKPGKPDWSRMQSAGDVQKAVHSVVWAARKSVYEPKVREDLPEGTKRQHAGIAIEFERFCKSISHERLPGGRPQAMRAINERRLDHVAELLTARALGTAPSYLLEKGAWQFPGRNVKQSVKVDILARNVAASDVARVDVYSEFPKNDRAQAPAREASPARAAGLSRQDPMIGRLQHVLQAVEEVVVHEKKAGPAEPAPGKVVVPAAALDRGAPLPAVIDAHKQVYDAVARVALAQVDRGGADGPVPPAGDERQEARVREAFVARRMIEAPVHRAEHASAKLDAVVPRFRRPGHDRPKDDLPAESQRRLECAEACVGQRLREKRLSTPAPPEKGREQPPTAGELRAVLRKGVHLPVRSTSPSARIEYSSRLAQEGRRRAAQSRPEGAGVTLPSRQHTAVRPPVAPTPTAPTAPAVPRVAAADVPMPRRAPGMRHAESVTAPAARPRTAPAAAEKTSSPAQPAPERPGRAAPAAPAAARGRER